ncbi:Hypothetical protein KVN_LOCUS424 [uncultured virus]|nr:Hypothetical protein KVN_LOCUS424 [uncultured virus]
MSKLNHGINYGHSSKLDYDSNSYRDKIHESTEPLLYRLNPIQIKNCNECLSTFGPRTKSGTPSNGVSTSVGNRISTSQDLVDVESILSNRNVVASNSKNSKYNDIDVTKFPLQNNRICNTFLDPIATHLTHPSYNYKEIAINRFVNLPRNPQMNIYYPEYINTSLEAKDNYKTKLPRIARNDPTLPKEVKGKIRECVLTCTDKCDSKIKN